ncbi:MAG: YceI family protein [Rhodanobacteraceae bacterium]
MRLIPYLFLLLPALVLSGVAGAAPVTYTIDPDHTYPSFDADHMGLSVWRGKFNHTTGTVTLDRTARKGDVDITVDVASIDFGNDALNKVIVKAKAPMCKDSCGLFDTAQYPKATYHGNLEDFVDGAPTRVAGTLALHGVTRPLDLAIDSFKCVPDFMLQPRERCGADAQATFNRDAFGIDAGKSFGIKMAVTLHIQVEAVENATPSAAASKSH